MGNINIDEMEGNIIIVRKRPQEPNFNKTPAKIIDPATGASTWALGNHKWEIYIGIFTKNAKDRVMESINVEKEGEKKQVKNINNELLI